MKHRVQQSTKSQLDAETRDYQETITTQYDSEVIFFTSKTFC